MIPNRKPYLTALRRIERELEGLRMASETLGQAELAALASAIQAVRIAIAEATGR